jgi:hypothetical protein
VKEELDKAMNAMAFARDVLRMVDSDEQLDAEDSKQICTVIDDLEEDINILGELKGV